MYSQAGTKKKKMRESKRVLFEIQKKLNFAVADYKNVFSFFFFFFFFSLDKKHWSG